MECYIYLRNVTDLLSDGKTPYEIRLGQPFKGPITPFGSLVEYHPRRTSRAKLEVTSWLQTLRSWRRWTHRKSTQKRLNAKEEIFPPKKRKFIFPIADGRIKPLGGDQDLRTSTLVQHRPIQGESHIDFLGESVGSLPQPHDSLPDAVEATFGPCQETSKTAITLNQESNFTRREKNHSLFHWSTLTSPELHKRTWMLCKKAASMTTGISMDQEICLILGQVSLRLLY